VRIGYLFSVAFPYFNCFPGKFSTIFHIAYSGKCSLQLQRS